MTSCLKTFYDAINFYARTRYSRYTLSSSIIRCRYEKSNIIRRRFDDVWNPFERRVLFKNTSVQFIHISIKNRHLRTTNNVSAIGSVRYQEVLLLYCDVTTYVDRGDPTRSLLRQRRILEPRFSINDARTPDRLHGTRDVRTKSDGSWRDWIVTNNVPGRLDPRSTPRKPGLIGLPHWRRCGV